MKPDVFLTEGAINDVTNYSIPTSVSDGWFTSVPTLPPPPPISPVLALSTATNTPVQSNEVDLQWTYYVTGINLIYPPTYTLVRSDGTTVSLSSSITSYSDYSVSPNTTYSYQIKAKDDNGTSSSNIISVTTPSAETPKDVSSVQVTE